MSAVDLSSSCKWDILELKFSIPSTQLQAGVGDISEGFINKVDRGVRGDPGLAWACLYLKRNQIIISAPKGSKGRHVKNLLVSEQLGWPDLEEGGVSRSEGTCLSERLSCRAQQVLAERLSSSVKASALYNSSKMPFQFQHGTLPSSRSPGLLSNVSGQHKLTRPRPNPALN
ncbi:unnamed protein product [Leuciscus chuanchicus]